MTSKHRSTTVRRIGPILVTGAVVLGALFVFRNRVLSWFQGVAAERGRPEADLPSREADLYTCPMHPSVQSEEPGPCPVCRMDLVPAVEGGSEEKPRERVAYYTCSMHPSVQSKDPGTCPVCSMDLVPVTHEEKETGILFIDAARRQLFGVKTGPVRRELLVQTIRTVGRVTYDETRLADIHLKFRGWIGELFADYKGKLIREGEPLFTVYSPDLLSAQEEYLEARRRSEQDPERGTALLESARNRLLLWDLRESQLEELARRGRALQYVPILSRACGTIIEKDVVRGSVVDPGRRLYRIADLTAVWVEADVYEYELPLVQVGQRTEITLSYLPGRRFEGEVSYVYPYLDEKTRTGRIRVDVENPEGLFKPHMYAEVRLSIPLGERLVVPEEAVLHAGESSVVFVDRGEGRIEPRKIRIGLRNRDLIEVLEGLEEGDLVVTSGNFLIAAESKLKAGMDKW